MIDDSGASGGGVVESEDVSSGGVRNVRGFGGMMMVGGDDELEGKVMGEADVAYFVQVSDNSLELLPRLLKRIWHERNLYALHFDAKIGDWKVERIVGMLNVSRGLDNEIVVGKEGLWGNVWFMKRETVTYRGISMVLNIMNAMEFLVKVAGESGKRWDFWINISGSDYPLLSPRDQRRLLGSEFIERGKKNFIGFFPKDRWETHQKMRFGKFFVDTGLALRRGLNKQTSVVKTHVEHPLAKDFGNFDFVSVGAWMVLHRSAVNELLSSSLARQLLALFSYAIEPEEHYFGTVFYNHPKLNDTLVHHSLRHVVWSKDGARNGNGQHPFYLDEVAEDGSFPFYKDVRRSAGVLFARKFRKPNSAFMDKIDREVNGLAQDVDRTKVDLYRYNAKRRLRCFAQEQNILTPCLSATHAAMLPDNLTPADFP